MPGKLKHGLLVNRDLDGKPVYRALPSTYASSYVEIDLEFISQSIIGFCYKSCIGDTVHNKKGLRTYWGVSLKKEFDSDTLEDYELAGKLLACI